MPEEKSLGIGIVLPLYDGLVDVVGWGNNFQAKLLSTLQLQGDEAILDVGSGTGTFGIMTSKKYPTIKFTGIDSDTKAVAVAKEKSLKKNLNIDFTRAYAQILPFKSGSFEVVVSSLVFHHMPTEVKQIALKEIYRVLKPQGRFMLADFGASHQLVLKLFFSVGQLLGFEDKKNAADNLLGRLPDMLRAAGFIVEEPSPPHRGIHFFLGIKIKS